ncbi:MAG: Hsp20/alpha crystallin family protein [Rhodococcus sp. (in: high G+C Gram-positive bacteria)]|uniref:Hsp20/alpha crystallin family protein n=1 Tax=Rhodococcus sp. TaxID=1831 RepID=UPI003BB03DA4
MSLPTPSRRSRALLPELSDLWGSMIGLRPFHDTHVIRVEDRIENGRYTLRAEVPDVDPEKDIEITVRDGQLTIKAERTEKHTEEGRSEFSYGSFVRSMTLPPGADEDDIEATYDRGILTVSVAVGEPAAAEKHIEIKVAETKAAEDASAAKTNEGESK